MRDRTLALAIWIAAATVPVSGCGDSRADQDAAADTPDTRNRAVEATAEPGNQAPLPIDGAASDSGPSPAAAPPAEPSLTDQLESLRQQLKTQRESTRQRLDRQANRIEQLEQTVADLTTRLKRLPPPSALKTTSSTADNSDAGNETAPDSSASSASPAASSTEPAGVTADSSTADNANSGGDGQPSTETDDEADAGTPHQDTASDDSDPTDRDRSPPSEPAQAASDSPGSDCAAIASNTAQFDVLYRASSPDAMASATRKVRSAGLTDWFATASGERLYLGRYGTCPLAARRRADVQARTGLDLTLAGVGTPANARAASRAADRSKAAERDYGRDAPALGRPTPPPSEDAVPFTIVGVEQRGRHQTLGVAAGVPSSLSDVTWLSPGQAFQGWRLQRIQPNAATATFAVDGRTATVALPEQG